MPSRPIRANRPARRIVPILLLCLAALSAHAQTTLILDTDAVSPQRFIAAHGQRALISGYASDSLEIWAYPFQILSAFRIAFLPSGASTPIDGQSILSRVTYSPDSITRIYLGPDFIVHEKLFVPSNQPAAILTYTVESPHPVDIQVHATPILNLMWPAALGGQSVEWSAPLNGFLLSEPAEHYTATVASPQILAHDEIGNRTVHGESAIALTLHPSDDAASLYIALNPPHSDPAQLLKDLIQNQPALEAESQAHLAAYEAQTLRIQTPDPAVNRAIAWAELALDQAWVCNPQLGCGFVAGYGPSRAARRPQYNWFFAGDGLIAASAASAAGDRTRARDELSFILRYQDPKSGMIWHELSQSAGFLDWANKYPYMYVHVDITFQFLSTLGHYIAETNDIAFAREYWPQISAAYRYCQSVISPATALPRIPPDKSGGNEQDRMSDDLGLSASWVEASSAYAALAQLTGHAQAATEAASASQRARAAIPTRYWDAQQSFWISGHTQPGHTTPEKPMPEQRSGPSEALSMHLFSDQQNTRLLDRIASSAFQTDWGSRSVAADSAGFDPESYSKGSISAIATLSLAQAFWSQHRPATALSLWQSILPWSSLDSLGHIHEVLAGNHFRPQAESVPEQTWSSAALVDATVHGLLGLQLDPAHNHLTFAPHLPAQWNDLTLTNLRLNTAPLTLKLHRERSSPTETLTLTIDNPGEPLTLDFTPQLPLGAKLAAKPGTALLNNQAISAEIQDYPQETTAHLTQQLPHGTSQVELKFTGGVSILTPTPAPLLGAPSTGIHIIDVHLDNHALSITADIPTNQPSNLQLQTPWPIASADNCTTQPLPNNTTQLNFPPEPNPTHPYRTLHATLHFKS